MFFLQIHRRLDFDIREDELQTIRFADVRIDLPTGRVYVDSRCDSVAEFVTLAFTVGSLFVTCQKKVSMNFPIMAAIGTGSVRSVKSAHSDGTLDFDNDSNSMSSGNKGSGGFARLSAKVRNKKLSRRRKLSASFSFLLACGLQVGVALYGTPSPSRKSSATNLAQAETPRMQQDVPQSNIALDVSESVVPLEQANYSDGVNGNHLAQGSRGTNPEMYIARKENTQGAPSYVARTTPQGGNKNGGSCVEPIGRRSKNGVRSQVNGKPHPLYVTYNNNDVSPRKEGRESQRRKPRGEEEQQFMDIRL